MCSTLSYNMYYCYHIYLSTNLFSGQNVNSYRDTSQPHNSSPIRLAKGFKTVYKLPQSGLQFAELLDRVADVNSEIRIRFTSPHPKDFPDDVMYNLSCLFFKLYYILAQGLVSTQHHLTALTHF